MRTEDVAHSQLSYPSIRSTSLTEHRCSSHVCHSRIPDVPDPYLSLPVDFGSNRSKVSSAIAVVAGRSDYSDLLDLGRISQRTTDVNGVFLRHITPVEVSLQLEDQYVYRFLCP